MINEVQSPSVAADFAARHSFKTPAELLDHYPEHSDHQVSAEPSGMAAACMQCNVILLNRAVSFCVVCPIPDDPVAHNDPVMACAWCHGELQTLYVEERFVGYRHCNSQQDHLPVPVARIATPVHYVCDVCTEPATLLVEHEPYRSPLRPPSGGWLESTGDTTLCAKCADLIKLRDTKGLSTQAYGGFLRLIGGGAGVVNAMFVSSLMASYDAHYVRLLSKVEGEPFEIPYPIAPAE